MIHPAVLISLDTEEFDMPMEYGHEIPFGEQLDVCTKGVHTLLPLLGAYKVKGTFFITANFAENNSELTRTISLHHEVGSHTYYHSRFQTEDLLTSKNSLERITGKQVFGLRMPRMHYVDSSEVIKAGYYYDSSINPTYLPGRYNNLDKPRTIFREKGLIRIPSSVSPNLRIPLFWLSFKNLPFTFYKTLCIQTLKKDGYLNLYFHPWEFVDLSQYKIPSYTKRYSKGLLTQRLENLLKFLSNYAEFFTIADYVSLSEKSKKIL